jgi:hypothetical protein
LSFKYIYHRSACKLPHSLIQKSDHRPIVPSRKNLTVALQPGDGLEERETMRIKVAAYII